MPASSTTRLQAMCFSHVSSIQPLSSAVMMSFTDTIP